MSAMPNPCLGPPESDPPIKSEINYIWPFIGLGFGTCVVMPLVLSLDPLQRLIGGLLFGGIPCGLIGLWYANRRREPHSKWTVTLLLLAGTSV